MITEKTVGKMTISEALPHLDSIANAYGLKLNRLKDLDLLEYFWLIYIIEN